MFSLFARRKKRGDGFELWRDVVAWEFAAWHPEEGIVLVAEPDFASRGSSFQKQVSHASIRQCALGGAENTPEFDGEAGLFGDLAMERCFEFLARIVLPAREFPLACVVLRRGRPLNQQHAPGIIHDQNLA